MAIALNPRWPREKLARVGRELSYTWLALNRLPAPNRLFFDRDSANRARREVDGKSKYMIRPEWLGVYQRPWEGGWSAIAVAVDECPVGQRLKRPHGAHIWQAPGSFEDFTPLGVMCHEVGHHVDHALHPEAYSRRNGFAEVADNEDEVSSVEYNVLESFAEAIRLFVTNPTLLKEGRPDRYEYLTKGMGLKPLHDRPWKVVLSKAGVRVQRAVEAWLRG